MSAALDHISQASAKYVLNHDIMNCTADGVTGNHLYSARALGISEPWDIIQLHPDLKSHYSSITEHYQRIGLSHSSNIIWNLDLKQIGSHIGYTPSVFFFGPEEYKQWGDFQWLETVDYINSKNNFMALANELGIDVPKTLCFNKASDVKAEDIQDIIYPCYLKAAVSVSGVGIYRCENTQELLEALIKFYDDTPVQIQEEIIAETFLNLQYLITNNEITQLAASEQVLDGFVHQGNRVPASHEPWALVEPMAHWLKERGMKGIFAFDVAIMQTDKGLRFPAIECNPRFNGATYPTLVANKLNIPEWTAITFSTQYRSFDDIDLADLEFNKQTGEGAIIINWGTISVGKLMILMAGSAEYQQALEAELKARL